MARLPAPRLSPGLVAFLLSLAAFAGGAWVATGVFDRVPHLEDEVTFLFQARTIAAGRLLAPAPIRPEFFEIPFTLMRDGQWFGKYPPGYPVVLALGVLAGQPWLLNPAAGALCVGLTYLAGRRLYGPATGLLAAALLTSSPLFLLQAGSFMSHVVALLWTLLFLILFAVVRERRSALAALAAGAVLGLLFLSRPSTAIGVGLPYAVWAATELVRRRGRALHYLGMVVGFLPGAAGLLLYNGLTTGHPLRSAYEVYWPHDRLGFGPGLDSDGFHGLDEGLRNTDISFYQLADYLFGWPAKLSLLPAVLAVGLAGVALIRRARSNAGVSPPGRLSTSPLAWDLLQLAVVLSLIGLHVAYWANKSLYGPRYYFEALGALVLLSARGLLQATDMLTGLTTRLAPAWQHGRRAAAAGVLLVLGALTLLAYTGFAAQELRRHTGWYGIDGAGLQQVRAAGLDNAVVFVQHHGWVDYAPFFAENAPTLDGPVVFAIDRGDDQNRALLRLYPGRRAYRYAGGQLVALPSAVDVSQQTVEQWWRRGYRRAERR